MKTKKSELTVKERNAESWKRATARSALVWGTVYSTATSGAACLIAPVAHSGALSFSDVFMDSLIIFPSAGAAHGLLLWRARKGKSSSEELFLSPKKKAHKHPWRVHSKAA